MPAAQRPARRAGHVVSGDGLRVRADADKLFFIDMLVKDIELIPAILDLADNSVDSARALRQGPAAVLEADADDDELAEHLLGEVDYTGLRVDLTVKPDSFSITDNCGGIDIDTARTYAFRFGRSSKFEGVPGSVGEFGVGMKRALFKLGREFTVVSRAESSWFELTVDVDEWAAQSDELDWTFAFTEAKDDLPSPKDSERGTSVTVTRLHPSVMEDFQDDLVLSLLREQLRLRHQRAIDAGLEIRLNGSKLSGLRPTLMVGPNFRPINRVFVIREPAGIVTVELVAGIVRSDRRDFQSDDDGEKFRTPGEAGWWVFCNNRLLLVADRSPETGWGNGAAAYHPQYRLFRGYVYMSALDTSLLPWNTTKTGVDLDSRVWRTVQTEMKSALVEVQAVLNRLKKEREQGDDDGRDSVPYTRALDSATPTSIRDLPRSISVGVPPIPKKSTPRPRKIWQRLQYDIPVEKYEKAMSVLGLSTAADLGRRSFDYFYKREVEDS